MGRQKQPGYLWDDDWRHKALMEWLCTAPSERECTKTQLAGKLGVDLRTLRLWQAEETFRREWETRAAEVLGDPEKTQAVLNTLYRAATDPKNRQQVQAAKLYLEATNAIKPPSMEVTFKRPAELSDEELEALLAKGAVELAKERDA